jgi:4-hydroxy-tetrahydrodipicolinate synthase
MNLRSQLPGTGVAMITPFTAGGTVDYTALGKLIDFIISNGVNYVITLGSTGEAATLNRWEQLNVINYTYEKVNGRVPVIVGIAGNDTAEVAKNIETYPLEKATAVLTASPQYNRPTQQGIIEHYKVLAKASPKPIIAYNVPSRTGSNMTAETTLYLAKEVDNIAGMKEASGNMVQCMHILRDRPDDFLVVSGDDHLTLPLIACGMDGVISVAANCFPKDFSDMVRYALKNDYAAARSLHYKCLEGNDLLFAENNPAGVKAFLYELGIIENVLRLPLLPLSDGVHQKVKAYLKK